MPNTLKLKLKREEQIIDVVLPFSSPHLTLRKLGVEKTNLYIDRVKNNSPADQAGLKKADRLFAFNGQILSSWEDLSGFIQKHRIKQCKLLYFEMVFRKNYL